jgi:hypothetical protein
LSFVFDIFLSERDFDRVGRFCRVSETERRRFVIRAGELLGFRRTELPAPSFDQPARVRRFDRQFFDLVREREIRRFARKAP